MDDVIKEARTRFSLAIDAESENRENAVDDLRFIEGDQWPEDIKTDRDNDNRPALVINKLPQYIRQVVNDIRQIRPAIKTRPVDSKGDPYTAETIQGMIRAIEQDCSAESAYDWAAEYAVKCGIGYWRITTDYAAPDSFEQIVQIKRIRNPFSVYFDPNSTEQDGSDAEWVFVTEKLSRDEFKAKYPDADEIEFSEYGQGDHAEWWVGQDYVRVAEYWCIKKEKQLMSLIQTPLGTQEIVYGEIPEGITILNQRETVKKTVVQYIINGAEVLDQTEWPGDYIPIIRVLGRETDIEGEVLLKGMARDMKDPQRMYNYHRSAEVERTALYSKAPWIGPRGAFKDPKWRTANKKNHAYLEYDSDVPPQREQPPEVSSAMVHQISVASDEIKDIAGIQEAAMGMKSTERTGVAVRQSRSEGDVSNFDFVDNLAKAMAFSGKVLVDLIPKVYTGQRMVRIVHADGKDENVTLNSPFIDESMRPRNYNLSAGRYDVVVDIGPSYATKREEATQSMLEALRAFPDGIQVIGDLLARNMDWPDADEVAKRMKLLLPPEIIQAENPAVAKLIQGKDQEINALKQQMQTIMSEAARMNVELQNKQRDAEIKLGELQRKIKKDAMDNNRDWTELEIEAMKNLGPEGRAY